MASVADRADGDASLQVFVLALAGLAAAVVYFWPLVRWQRDRQKRGLEEAAALQKARLAKFCPAKPPSPARLPRPSKPVAAVPPTGEESAKSPQSPGATPLRAFPEGFQEESASDGGPKYASEEAELTPPGRSQAGFRV
ncbi:unnamed protein product [Symbiodinium natans]|uniref:Transmembrane protein n=1 Tax=Symbiodinium natans TaxID=878477 RepID=A0A812JAB6_9DINO|nr:unnamed protein product [Symbiodinium natans]